MYTCSRCSSKYNSYNLLARHSSKVHDFKGELLKREYFHNNVIPKCQCGCGENVNWHNNVYLRYRFGHGSRGALNSMFGKHHSEEAKENISKKRKEKFAKGEYRIWQNEDTEETRKMIARIGEMSRKENNPERAKKISDYFKGRPKSVEHKTKMWAGHQKWLSTNTVKFNNKLEKLFSSILDTLKIEYRHPFPLQNKVYDYHLLNTKILIEVDGDFWHCNPATKWETPVYECQKVTAANDKLKNELAKSAGYTLLRFWESDINENPQKVIQTLLDAIK